MKYLIWIGLAIAILLLIRLVTPVKRRRNEVRSAASGRGDGRGRAADRGRDAVDRGGRQELMMRCSLCGVHVPSSDAVFARGRVYCSTGHRDADERDGGAAGRADGRTDGSEDRT
ncbi:MAG: PP0621 family protein [Burkholderiaceae bacterium]